MSVTFLVQNGDIVYDPSGQLRQISGKEKVRQDLREVLSIAVQPDGFGAGIVDLIGQDNDMDDGLSSSLEFALRDRLRGGVERFISLQRKSSYNRTPDEMIVRILAIEAAQNPNDPTTYFWRVEVQTLDGQRHSIRGNMQT